MIPYFKIFICIKLAKHKNIQLITYLLMVDLEMTFSLACLYFL